MVADGRTGYLIDPHDADDIAWRLEVLLTDGALRERMGTHARTVAADRFHPLRVAQRTHEVYQRALRP
jgi:glycosyltransferase involved in cell wall biosynthesis